MPSFDLNWIAVVLAAVVYFVLGAVWYGPLFGKMWVAGMGLNPDSMQAAKSGFVITFVANLGLATALASITAGLTGAGAAMQAAFWLWLGLVATTATVNAVWDSRPWSVLAINQGYHLVAMLLAAAIVGAWK